MAFAYTMDDRSNSNNRKKVSGTYTNGAGDTGGTIKTGLTKITNHGVTNGTDENAVESSISGGDLTLDCTDGDDGTWFAEGW